MPAPITPPTASAVPAVPDRADRATFSVRATAIFDYVKNTMWVDMAAFVANAYANAVIAYDSAVTAVASALSATNSASAAAASAASVGTVWISGTTYAVGDMRYSPINFATYRRIIAGAGTTDPALDPTNWGPSVPVSGAGGVAITGSVILTSTSPSTMMITPTAPGQGMKLPVGTTCNKADNLFSGFNVGPHDYYVADSTGKKLGWILPLTGGMVGLSDNTTPAGVWVPVGLEKYAITAVFKNKSATGTNTAGMKAITLDANRTLFLFGGTTCYAVVYDASTNSWGSATSIRASIASGGAYVGVLSATDQVLVCTCDSTTGLEAITLTISGTVVTPNTGTKHAVVLAGNFVEFGQLIAVSTSFAVSYGRATTTSGIRAITVTGTTPAMGAESALVPATTTAAVLFALGSIVRTVSLVSGASGLSCKPYTVTGNALAAGTAASATTSSTSLRTFLNGNGNIVCEYINTTHYATIFKLTTTVEAASSVSLGTVPTNVTSQADYVALTASKTVFLSGAGAVDLYANILTDTAGTASAGTEINITIAQNIANVCGFLASGNTARFGAYANNAGQSEYSIFELDCSGASPVYSSQAYMRGSTGFAVAPFGASDFRGLKNARMLFADTTAIAMASNDLQWDTMCMGTAFKKSVMLPYSGNPASGSVSGASNVSYITQVPNGSTTGFIIQKVECAA